MMLEEKIAMAQTIRSRDRFGPVSPEELAESAARNSSETVA